ncbi:MAG: hypothetical protein UY18_C0002G0034 [Microgenomates group bacterium GW2011_GWF2_47_9]|nr:MAG: hypothetical protein UY18_C0002G0034 [Microgenomates group bacterium GW2011_GWF2_47_9]
MAVADDAPLLSDLPIYIGNVLQAVIPLIGIISFIMILVGGFTILTGSGNPENIKKGGQTITLAVVGLALAIISWLILLLVKNLTGVDVTQFDLSF